MLITFPKRALQNSDKSKSGTSKKARHHFYDLECASSFSEEKFFLETAFFGERLFLENGFFWIRFQKKTVTLKIFITFVHILASCCLLIMRVFSFIDYVCFCRSDSGWRCGGRFWILCSSRSCHAEFGRITRHRVKLNGTVGLSDENSADILVTRVLWFFRGGCNKLKIDKLKG